MNGNKRPTAARLAQFRQCELGLIGGGKRRGVGRRGRGGQRRERRIGGLECGRGGAVGGEVVVEVGRSHGGVVVEVVGEERQEVEAETKCESGLGGRSWRPKSFRLIKHGIIIEFQGSQADLICWWPGRACPQNGRTGDRHRDPPPDPPSHAFWPETTIMPKNIWVAAGDGDLERVKVRLSHYSHPSHHIHFLQDLVELHCKSPHPHREHF